MKLPPLPQAFLSQGLAEARIVVISPHLDDAVLSAFSLLRADLDVEVVTAFTAPRPDGAPSEWDIGLGYNSSIAAMDARLEEDRRAMELVNVPNRHLGLREVSYREPDESEESVVAALQSSVGEILAERSIPTVLALPGALGDDPSRARMVRQKLSIPRLRVRPGGAVHIDHRIVHHALFRLALDTASKVIVYEDLPYAWAGGQQRLRAVGHRPGISFERPQFEIELSRKEAVLKNYKSQYPTFFPGWTDQFSKVFDPYEMLWLFRSDPGQVRIGGVSTPRH